MSHQPLAEQDDRTLLDEASIIRIRQYIARKHPGLSSARRAEILADAVYRAVDQELPEFEPGTKANLRRELIRRMGTSGRFRLRTSQVVEACRQLELQEAAQQQLEHWVIEQRSAVSEAAGGQRNREQDGAVLRLVQLEPGTGVPELPKRRGRRGAMSAVILLLALVVLAVAGGTERNSAGRAAPVPAQDTAGIPGETVLPGTKAATEAVKAAAVISNMLDYRAIDPEKLRDWLNKRNSLLAEEPYLSAILNAAEEYQVHPLLLFAITGQEQGYVPRDRKQASRIANNPFNVYHSWQRYNTTIEDSARTAARTILSISRTRPQDEHPILWLNTRYAEDPKWGAGVRSIFEKMLQEIGELPL